MPRSKPCGASFVYNTFRLFRQNFFRQSAGDKRIRNGMISSRPTSISKLNTILESGENIWKFSTGPTFDIPGPTLFMGVRTPLKDVAKSKLSIDTISTDAASINTYAAK